MRFGEGTLETFGVHSGDKVVGPSSRRVLNVSIVNAGEMTCAWLSFPRIG